MIEPQYLLLPVALAVVAGAGGIMLAWWRERRASGAEDRVRRGRGLTVPVLVGLDGNARRAFGVVDEGRLRVVGARTALVLEGSDYLSAGIRRHGIDEDVLEFATQRGFVDAAGTRYLVGALEEWEPALVTAIGAPPRPASRWRLVRAAAPRTAVSVLAVAGVALLAFQVVWSTGHDERATMVRVVGDEGMESCAVRWQSEGRSRYAEVDCYEPFPQPGAPVTVRALAWPFTGGAMDHEGTYEGLTAILGGATLLAGGVAVGATTTRLRRPPVRLAAVRTAEVAWTPSETIRVGAADPFPAQLRALSVVEQWSDGVTSAPEQPWYQRHLLAVGSARWWPVPALMGAGLLVEDLPHAVRLALVAGAAAVGLWAVYRCVSTWLALAPAYADAVTSEWEYRLLRTVDDVWLVLLFLGERPHWLVELLGEGHPAPEGWSGVRGDLRDGGAVQLVIAGEPWMSGAPVTRVDDAVFRDLRDEVSDRLADLGGPGRAATT